MTNTSSRPTSNQLRAPAVTVASCHTIPVIQFYNPQVPVEEVAKLGKTDHPMAPEADLNLLATGHEPMPDPCTGRRVVIEVLSRAEGASYGEVWTELRRRSVDSWDSARKLNGTSPSNGLGMVRRHGYRLTYSVSTGKYRAIKE